VYPFPPLMTPPAGGLTPRGPDNPAFRPDAPRRRSFGSYGYSGYSPFILGYGDPTVPVTQAPTDLPLRATGWLQLEVTPLTAQVFVDTLYVGTVSDVNAKRQLQLEAGPHRIEIRAPLHQPLVVDVRIAPNETVTYRGALDIVRPAAPPPPAVARASMAGAGEKMYVISNCYIGNVPPRAGRLPAGCDIKQVQVLGGK
jgi:hypothetical protein